MRYEVTRDCTGALILLRLHEALAFGSNLAFYDMLDFARRQRDAKLQAVNCEL